MATAPDDSKRASKLVAANGGASRPSSVAKAPPHQALASDKAADKHDAAVEAAGGGQQLALALDPISGPVIFNDNPNPTQAPYVVPGVRATRQSNTYLNSSIVAKQQPGVALGRKTNWGFRFHYNPPQISESVQTNYSMVPDPSDVGTVLGTGLGTMSFQFLINRQEDVAAHRKLIYPMLGKKTFYDLGTLYDIEFLYRTINGDPQTLSINSGTTGPKKDPNGSANLGFLYMTAVEIRFNNIVFQGFINSLSFEHVLFSDKMVPTLTYVTVSATRYLSGSGLPGSDQSNQDTSTDSSSSSSSSSTGAAQSKNFVPKTTIVAPTQPRNNKSGFLPGTTIPASG